LDGPYAQKKEVTDKDFEEFPKTHKEVEIENAKIRIGLPQKDKAIPTKRIRD
jgi:hypothetical protein